jgi:integrase
MASYQNRGTKKKPSWQYVISHKPKPIRKSGFLTKKEAQVAAAEVEAKLKKGVVPHLRLEPFDEYFQDWIKIYKPNVGKGTKHNYKYSFVAIQKHFGSKPIQQIKKREYQEFLNEYGSTRSKEQVEKVNGHIRSCVQDAIDEGILQVDFTRKAVVTGSVPAKKPSEKHLNYKDSERALNEIHKRLDRGLGYYLLLLGVTSGLRFAELVGLTRSDFNFANNTISVNKTWGYQKKMHEGFGPTKNEESVRIVKIDKFTMQAFKRLFDNTPTNIHQLVFYSPASKYKVVSNNNANKLLKSVLNHLKIPVISAHGLRHTHASILLYKRRSIYYVSERLGHKNIETTLKTYAHVMKELRQEDEKETVGIFENMVV